MNRRFIERRKQFLTEKWLNDCSMTDEELRDWDLLFPDDDDDDPFGDIDDDNDDIFSDV